MALLVGLIPHLIISDRSCDRATFHHLRLKIGWKIGLNYDPYSQNTILVPCTSISSIIKSNLETGNMGSQILIPVFADERENYAEPMTLFSILSVGILLAPNVFLEEHWPMMTIPSNPIPIHFLLSIAQTGTKWVKKN